MQSDPRQCRRAHQAVEGADACAAPTEVGRRGTDDEVAARLRSRSRATSAATTTAGRRARLLRAATKRVLRLGDALAADRPIVVTAFVDRVLGHEIFVIQQRLTVARREVEDRVVRRDRVVDRLAEMPFLRRDWRRPVATRQLLVGSRLFVNRMDGVRFFAIAGLRWR